MRTITRLLTTAALPLVLLGLTGCEVTDPLEGVDLRIDLTDASVEIPESVGSVTVDPDRPTAASGSITNETDIASIEELKAIKLEPGFFVFTSAPTALAAEGAEGPTVAAANGTIRVFLFMGGVPLPDMPITLTVENDEVTAVTPQTITIAGSTVDAAAIEAYLEALPEEDRPELDDWQSMTIDQVVAEINAALSSSSFPFTIGVEATGELSGTLRLGEIAFDAEVLITEN